MLMRKVHGLHVVALGRAGPGGVTHIGRSTALLRRTRWSACPPAASGKARSTRVVRTEPGPAICALGRHARRRGVATGVEGAGGASRGIQPPGLGIGAPSWRQAAMISGGEPGPAVPERKPGCRAGPRRRHRWPAREPSTAATHGVDPAELRAALDNMEGGELPPPVVAEEAVQGLKYRPGAARQLRPRPQSRRPRSTGPCRAGHRRRRRTRSRQLGSRSLAHRPERRI